MTIYIHKGDDTIFGPQEKFITFIFETELDLTGWKAQFKLGGFTKVIEDISSKQFDITISHSTTVQLPLGKLNGSIVLIDNNNRIKTVINTIPFVVTKDVIEQQYETIDLTIPKSSGVDIKMRIGGRAVYSINGKTGEVILTAEDVGAIPEDSIATLATYEYVDTSIANTQAELDDTNARLNQKADIDYVNEELDLKADKTEVARKANISDIPTRVSQLVNDEGYITEHQDISGKADIDYVDEALGYKADKADTYTKVEINTLIDDVNDNIELKQDKLTVGENITIDENNVISAIGGTSGGVTSVNGKTGEVELTAEDVGALIQEDLTDYVKNTDYATSSIGGVFKVSSAHGFQMSASGLLIGRNMTLEEYNKGLVTTVVSKGALESIKDDYVKRGVTTNTIELTDEEKASAKQWLGYATSTDIMQAIASIPQFSISIVEALPETGEKMTLYLVSKGTESPDVYDEYIWIEQTSSFEFLGTTAVDLTDYVKNTDYASATKGGVVKLNSVYGIGSAGQVISIIKATDDEVQAKIQRYRPIVPANLDLAVKTGVTTNTIELTDEEKTNARAWLDAIGSTDYVTTSKAGIVTVGAHYGTQILNTQGLIGASTRTLELYNSAPTSLFVGKGTLENVLTQYSKTVLITQANYDALETKDANTLYLIEE